jgi:hypothetical protein
MNGRFIAEVEYDRYLIECETQIAENIEDIRREFDEWLYDKTNGHGLWAAYPDNPSCDLPNVTNDRDGISYGIADFLAWLNRNYDSES